MKYCIFLGFSLLSTQTQTRKVCVKFQRCNINYFGGVIKTAEILSEVSFTPLKFLPHSHFIAAEIVSEVSLTLQKWLWLSGITYQRLH
jgi:hypothetical protein